MGVLMLVRLDMYVYGGAWCVVVPMVIVVVVAVAVVVVLGRLGL